jgi:3-methyladenine DNA glycosylase AlkC
MGVMNELIDTSTVRRLQALLRQADTTRDWTAVGQSSDRVDGLQLRARSDLVAAAILDDNSRPQHDMGGVMNRGGRGSVDDSLRDDRGSTPGHLGDDHGSTYDRLAATVRRALLSPELSGWMVWPVSEAVTSAALLAWSTGSAEGSSSADPRPAGGAARQERDGALARFDDGLELLAQLTPRLTGEFAIRRFLAADLDRAIADIMPWTLSEDEHVRRLASEGTRPFLPWAIRVGALTASPEKTVPILDALRRDRSEYVRRSVANHVNDLSRHNPELVIQTAQRWLSEPDPNTRWVVRHGLRTLVKKADPRALALMGFPEARVQVSPISVVDETVLLPGALDFSFAVTNDGDERVRLAVDYVVSYVKSSGSLNEKVFKLTTRDVEPGERIELRKRHAIHQMTTRVHYAGTHLIELQINGRRYSRRPFEVEIPLPLPPP